MLELRNISKVYPGIKALDNCCLDLLPGEVHALVGENGAGKSTLIKIATGVVAPSSGSLFLDNQEINWSTPNDAIDRGIGAVYQDPSIFPDLNIAENIFMNHHPINPITRFINWNKLYEKTDALLKKLNIYLDPKEHLGRLSAAERQLVEVAKALSINTKVLFMDEPTSTLSATESELLFNIIRQLKEDGTTIVFISHRLDDIFKVADRVTALRDGQSVGTETIDNVDHESLVQMMVGREVKDLYPKTNTIPKEEVLRINELSRKDEFSEISFSLKQSEILGLYGLVGAGRTEMAKCIYGMTQADKGEIYLRGNKINIENPKVAIKAGIAYLAEDRDEEGLILDMEIDQNISLPNLMAHSNKLGWLDIQSEKDTAQNFVDKLEIKASSLSQKTGGLSGGNKQKVSLAKWMATDCKILILDEPTKGIDVAAKAAVHQLINQLVENQYAVILISSDLPEIMGMSDRALVMHDGQIKGEFERVDFTEESILNVALSEHSPT